MKSIRELINILESIENSVHEARRFVPKGNKTPRTLSATRKKSMTPGEVTTTTIDPTTGETITTTEKPTYFDKISYYKYLVPLDKIIQAREMGLKRMNHPSVVHSKYPGTIAYWYASPDRHQEAEEVFGPGEFEEKSKFKGTTLSKDDTSPTITPNTLKHKDPTIYRNNLPGGDASGEIDPDQQFRPFSSK